MVIVQEATETLTHFDLSYSLRHHPADNLVADPLMAALVVVVSHVLGNRPIERRLPRKHHLAQALRRDRPAVSDYSAARSSFQTLRAQGDVLEDQRFAGAERSSDQMYDEIQHPGSLAVGRL